MIHNIDTKNLGFLGMVLAAPILSLWTGFFRAEWFIAYCCGAFVQLSIKESWGVREAKPWKKLVAFLIAFSTLMFLTSTVSKHPLIS